MRSDEDGDGKDDGSGVSVGHTMGSILGSNAPGGFWAVPARPDYWSFAAAAAAAAPASEMVVQAAPQQQSSLFSTHHHHHHQQQPMGEASAARVGNYIPGHLNLLASLSGGPGNSGRREDDGR